MDFKVKSLWRGPNRDGEAASFAAPTVWPERLTQKWKVQVGLGYATPLLVGNRIYLFSRQGDNEVMSAFASDSGKVIWQTGYPAAFTMNSAAVKHGEGPKSTPVFSNGRLHSIGMTGVVTAFDAATGKWTSAARQAGNAAIVRAGDVVFSLQDDGQLAVFRGSPTTFELVRRYTVAESETWTQPTVSGNRIFVKDGSNLTLWTLN
jgi:outer membrane protein assembly factor BamB